MQYTNYTPHFTFYQVRDVKKIMFYHIFCTIIKDISNVSNFVKHTYKTE